MKRFDPIRMHLNARHSPVHEMFRVLARPSWSAAGMANRLFFGDNLDVLMRADAESVDLIYLDPPFNSNADYNILFRSPDGEGAEAQLAAFEDSWRWNDRAEDAYYQLSQSAYGKLHGILACLRTEFGQSDMMAYLVMIAIRLVQLHRVLKSTGSLYLHCDPTASHYLKMLLDAIFGADRFRSEIIWKRTSAHNGAKRWGPIHDVILFYSKGATYTWNKVRTPYSDDYVRRFYRHQTPDGRRYRLSDLTGSGTRGGESGRPWGGFDPTAHGRHWGIPSILKAEFGDRKLSPHGWLDLFEGEGLIHRENGGWPHVRRYLDRMEGQALQDIVDDISPLSRRHAERLGYPTQKPLALLDRIIAASSNPGDTVLDPFCGCGTAIHAAHRMDRRWIGIDVTHLAISLIEKRMQAAFPGIAFTVEGTPKDMEAARDLARRDKYQFQWWAVSMVDAMPFGGRRKGPDGGIDGILYFKPDGRRIARGLVSVKGGDTVGVHMIRDLHSTMEREKAPAGIFITKAVPTIAMAREAAAVGRFHSEATGRSYARLQILTVADLFRGRRPELPFPDAGAAFRRAPREDVARQDRLI